MTHFPITLSRHISSVPSYSISWDFSHFPSVLSSQWGRTFRERDWEEREGGGWGRDLTRKWKWEREGGGGDIREYSTPLDLSLRSPQGWAGKSADLLYRDESAATPHRSRVAVAGTVQRWIEDQERTERERETRGRQVYFVPIGDYSRICLAIMQIHSAFSDWSLIFRYTVIHWLDSDQ